MKSRQDESKNMLGNVKQFARQGFESLKNVKDRANESIESFKQAYAQARKFA